MSNHFVQNNENGPVVFSGGKSAKDYIEWGEKGSQDGNDIQIVSDEVFSDPTFQRMVRRGVFSEVQDRDAIESSQQRQSEGWEARRQGFTETGESAIVNEKNRDLVTEPCIGPNVRGNDTCGEPVVVSEEEKGKVPPLCQKHKSLASQFFPDYAQDGEKTSTGWVRATMGERERQSN